jgi:hypothetical protein
MASYGAGIRGRLRARPATGWPGNQEWQIAVLRLDMSR